MVLCSGWNGLVEFQPRWRRNIIILYFNQCCGSVLFLYGFRSDSGKKNEKILFFSIKKYNAPKKTLFSCTQQKWFFLLFKYDILVILVNFLWIFHDFGRLFSTGSGRPKWNGSIPYGSGSVTMISPHKESVRSYLQWNAGACTGACFTTQSCHTKNIWNSFYIYMKLILNYFDFNKLFW